MLDEADLITRGRVGDLLPGFLRALMQEPQYPLLVLFCGTYELRRARRDYSSTLFNTAKFLSQWHFFDIDMIEGGYYLGVEM
jgi:hypothetical protein